MVTYPLAEVELVDAAARAKRRARDRGRRYRKPPLPATPHALFGLKNNWHPDAPEDLRLVRLTDTPISLSLGVRGATPNAKTAVAGVTSVR